ncbi:hypothetical protein OROHE_021486 [Orobanche hederae]
MLSDKKKPAALEEHDDAATVSFVRRVTAALSSSFHHIVAALSFSLHRTHNDPSDPTHNNHQTRYPNPDAPEPASNLNKPTTTTPFATSTEELNVDDQIPRDGMIFDSEEEVRAFYNKYGHEVGFGVRQSSTLTRGKLKYFALGCSKGGKYAPKEGSSKLKLSSKTGCEAKNFVSVRSTGRCVISQVNLDHNHGLSPTKSRFQRSHKTLDPYSKRRLKLNDCAGIPMNKNFHSLVVEARGYENLQFDERDCRNYIAKVRQLRLGVGDAEALRNYFLRMQRRNSNFFMSLIWTMMVVSGMFFGQMQGLEQRMTHMGMSSHLIVHI